MQEFQFGNECYLKVLKWSKNWCRNLLHGSSQRLFFVWSAGLSGYMFKIWENLPSKKKMAKVTKIHLWTHHLYSGNSFKVPFQSHIYPDLPKNYPTKWLHLATGSSWTEIPDHGTANWAAPWLSKRRAQVLGIWRSLMEWHLWRFCWAIVCFFSWWFCLAIMLDHFLRKFWDAWGTGFFLFSICRLLIVF